MSRMSTRPLKRIFLLGSNISWSISPAMLNQAFEKTGFGATFELLEFPESRFESVMREIDESSDVLGFTVTAPYKETIMPYLSRMDSGSKIIGAVNAVRISRSGKMVGYNTDLDGIVATLSKLGVRNRDKSVILGAGGAARACIYASIKFGFESIVILNRSRERAKKVRTHFEGLFPKTDISVRPLQSEQLSEEIQDANLLINAVTNPFPISVSFSGAMNNLRFMDLGYKEPSSILTEARNSKIKSMDGLLMLVVQGAKAFEIWTGLEAPTRSMFLAAKRALENPKRQPFRSL